MKLRGPDMPMVVAGNKTDVEPALEREQTEALVSLYTWTTHAPDGDGDQLSNIKYIELK